MSRILKVKFQDECNGCELCVMEIQHQLQKIGLEGSLIRILRNQQDNSKKVDFHVELDPHTNKLDIDRIAAVCPKAVFEIVSEEEHEFNS